MELDTWDLVCDFFLKIHFLCFVNMAMFNVIILYNNMFKGLFSLTLGQW